MAIGLGGVAFVGSVPALLLCVALFSIGALLASPSQQTVTAGFSNPAALGSYFGVNALALALGGGLGNYSGGLLYGLGKDRSMPALPWLIFCAVGVCAALGMGLLHRRQVNREKRGAGGGLAAKTPIHIKLTDGRPSSPPPPRPSQAAGEGGDPAPPRPSQRQAGSARRKGDSAPPRPSQRERGLGGEGH
jgi:MFS family permease